MMHGGLALKYTPVVEIKDANPPDQEFELNLFIKPYIDIVSKDVTS